MKLLATKGDQIARLNIKSSPAERPKILEIELLNKLGKKTTEKFSYGQTVLARVHCLHMERRRIYVTLWEDDVAGGGHSEGNKKNEIKTLSGIVESGVADVEFLLSPSFAKIANKGGVEADKIHEYYVTTNFDTKIMASKNVNVNDIETPIAPFRGRAPINQNKARTPAPTKAVTGKSEITKVHITDAAGHDITGVFKDKQIKVWIDSVGLIGKEIRLKLYDKDYVADDY